MGEGDQPVQQAGAPEAREIWWQEEVNWLFFAFSETAIAQASGAA
jgi:hypothetical protein